MTLKPYNPDSGCEMCGWEAIWKHEHLTDGNILKTLAEPAGSRFCNDNQCTINEMPIECYKDTLAVDWPHIHRTCPRCGYEWIESTIAKSAT